jgi:hypothetical protein
MSSRQNAALLSTMPAHQTSQAAGDTAKDTIRPALAHSRVR